MKKLCLLLALAAMSGTLTMCSSSKTAKGALSPLPPSPSAEGQHPGIQVQFNVPVPMRDGVKLRADVFTPDGPGP